MRPSDPFRDYWVLILLGYLKGGPSDQVNRRRTVHDRVQCKRLIKVYAEVSLCKGCLIYTR
jgi:hypothetical protein